MNNMELLAPAGGMKELKAAVQSGADAVYLGATLFSARAGAGNFDEDEMRDAVSYAHTYGVKVHCAINTLIKETEFDAAIKTAIMANNCGVDALIIQDLGLASHIRKILPQMELHASTQMTVTTLSAVKYLEKMGFSRVVLARELSLSEIEYIAKNSKAEIEVFVHGAICMCYSGQCLMSSILGGRSGNRGKCAQPCRLPYELMAGDKTCARGHILSPKDMALISHLDKLKKAGVKSLKIEGRLKSAEYVSAVVGVYRKYIDNPRPVDSEDMQELRNAFSRSGFTDGYLTDKLGKDMMSHSNPANNSGSIYTAEAKQRAEGKYIRKIPINVYISLKQADVIRATAYDERGNCVECQGDIKVVKADKTPLDDVRVHQQMCKLGDTPFELESLTVDIDKDITVPIKELNSVRRKMCEMLIGKLSKTEERAVVDFPLQFTETTREKELYLTADVCTKEQGEAVIKAQGVKRIYTSPIIAEHLKKIANDIEIVGKTPDIADDDIINNDNISVSSIADIEKYGEKAKYAEWRLNVYNSVTANTISHLKCITLSPELNLRDIKSVAMHTPNTETEIIGYGRLPLMIMKNCPIKAVGKCQNGKNIYTLKDRKGMEFPVICTGTCKAILLNSKPIYTADIIDEIKKSQVDCIRLNFTVEKPEECGKITQMYIDALKGRKAQPMPENTYTRGHLKRGV